MALLDRFRTQSRHKNPDAAVRLAAEQEAVRRSAFDRLQDHGEILSVALNAEFKDPTLAAVERVTDRGELEQIASRARNKSASKRARAILREADERAALEAAAAAKE